MHEYRYVPGKGNPKAGLMICGEAPGEYEEKQGEAFVGPTGQMVREMLKEAGVDPSECWFTNVFKYRPPNNELWRAEQTGHTIEECIPQLWEEVETVDPYTILAVGDLALSTLTHRQKITKQRGSILQAKNGRTKVVPTVHPARLLPRKGQKAILPYSAKVYIQLDFNRAVEESRTRELVLPTRYTTICKSLYHLHTFLNQYKDEKLWTIDFEGSENCVPTLLGLAPNSSHAISIPLLPLSEVVSQLGLQEYEIVEMWMLLCQFLEDPTIKIVCHNGQYDFSRFHMMGIRPKLYADTAMMAHCLYPEFPKKLEFLTSWMTREPYYKDEGRGYVRGKDPIDRHMTYNGKDCMVTHEIFHTLDKDLDEIPGMRAFYYDYYHHLHDHYLEQGKIGLRMNLELQQELFKKYMERVDGIHKELIGHIGHEVNVRSNPQLVNLLYGELKFPVRLNKDGNPTAAEEVIVGLLGNHAKDERKRRILTGIIDERRVRTLISNAILALPDVDLRMRTSVNITGTETSRRSTSNLEPPLRPIMKIGKKKKAIGINSQSSPQIGDFAAARRKMYIPDEGHIFLEADLGQAEPRIVAILGNDEQTLQMFESGMDMHRKTAAWLFEVPENIIHKESPMRFVGKMTRNAGNYDEHKHTLMETVNAEARRFSIDIQLSEQKAGVILDRFHRFTPKIRGVFHPSVREALQSNGRVLINPFGRYRMFFDKWEESLFRQAYAHIPQSTVADKVASSILEIRKRIPWLKFLLDSHDGFLTMPPINRVEEAYRVIKEVMEVPIDFSRCTIKRGLLRIPCEVSIGENYKDLKKYELAA